MAQSPRLRPPTRQLPLPNSVLPERGGGSILPVPGNLGGLGGWPWASQGAPAGPFPVDHVLTPPQLPRIPGPAPVYQQGMDAGAFRAATQAWMGNVQTWRNGLRASLLTWRRGGN